MSSQETAAAPARQKIERELTGAPIAIGERTIQPVARMTGWRMSPSAGPGSSAGRPAPVQIELKGQGKGEYSMQTTGSGGAARVQLTPVEVRVQEGDGREYSVPIKDATAEQIRQMITGALIFGAICWFVALLLNWAARKRPRRKR